MPSNDEYQSNRSLCWSRQNIVQDNQAAVINPNFYPPVLLQKQILKSKKLAKEGSVVFIASRAPFAPAIGNAIYSASKGAELTGADYEELQKQYPLGRYGQPENVAHRLSSVGRFVLDDR